jgi:hypothetical protein
MTALKGGRKGRRLLVLIAAMVGVTLVLRRQGYGVGGNTLVRCRQGHLFTTIWIPGVSVKSLRLGWWRFQRCPVGKHWDLVRPVRAADLSADELLGARAVKDIRIP